MNAANTAVLWQVAVYSWNLRGELKRAARGLVQGFYGFKPLVDPPSQLYNRQLAALLSRNRTFTYEVRAALVLGDSYTHNMVRHYYYRRSTKNLKSTKGSTNPLSYR